VPTNEPVQVLLSLVGAAHQRLSSVEKRASAFAHPTHAVFG